MSEEAAWQLARVCAIAACAALAGCATQAPGKAYFVKPAPFPVSVAATPDADGGSVFPLSASGSLYGNQQSWQPGDVVSIDVTLNATAQDSDAGSLTKAASLNASVSELAGIPLSFGHINGGSLQPSVNMSDKSSYSGTGGTSGSNAVTTELAGVVTQIEPNGVLALSGRTNVNINGNVTGIDVTGYARPQDIGPNNTINFNNLADSNIQYVGTGPENSAHHVPWLQDVFSRYSPF